MNRSSLAKTLKQIDMSQLPDEEYTILMLKNRHKMNPFKISTLHELFLGKLSRLLCFAKRCKCCQKSDREKLFMKGRDKLANETDIVSFIKKFCLIKGAIKSLTTND